MLSKTSTLTGLGLATLALAMSACGSGSSGQSSFGPRSGSGSSSASAKRPITIGSLQPLSGPVNFFGLETQAGIKLAIADINASGGIKSLGGRPVRLVSADSSSSDVNAATVAMAQLIDKHPVAVIGPTDSSTFIPASTVAERSQVPICTSSFTDNITTRGAKYSFETPTTATKVAETTAANLSKVIPSLHVANKKVAILYDATNPTLASEVEPLAAGLQREGYQIVYKHGVAEGISSALSLATAIRASGAGLLVNGMGDPGDALTINKAMAAEKVQIPSLLPGGGPATSAAYGKTLGKLVNGSFVVTQWDWSVKYPSSAQNKLLSKIEAQYVKQTGDSFMGEFAGEAYACTMQFAEAMNAAHAATPAAVEKEMKSMTFSSGGGSLFPPGVVKYNAAGLNTKALNDVSEWCHGKPYVVYPRKYATAPVRSATACGL